jgi:hypothetical protein
MDSHSIISLLETGKPIPKRKGELFFAFQPSLVTGKYIEMPYSFTGLATIPWIYSPIVTT